MPYDPNFPPANAELLSADFRSQFQGLKALIDALQSLTAAQVDGVTTLSPGQPATAAVSVAGDTLHFTFGLPQGADGSNGTNGSDGVDGLQGPPGPSVANAIIDSVTTLPPGSSATVGVTFDGSAVHFIFALPRGNDGANGADGLDGTNGLNGLDGAQGPVGATGEVSASQLATAIAGTSANTNGVSTLGLAVSDPPTQTEMQAIANKLDELIMNGRR